MIDRPENGGKTCSGGDQKYKLCSTEQVNNFLLSFSVGYNNIIAIHIVSVQMHPRSHLKTSQTKYV